MADRLENVEYSGLRLPRTLALAQKIAEEWSTNLLIIKMARRIKHESGATSKLQEASAVRNWINSRVRYVSDPSTAELVGTPMWTLEHGGDCDDQAALAGALLLALGHKVAMAAVKWTGRQWPTHAVLVDFTAGAIVDPVAECDMEEWPPYPYEVEEVTYRTPSGQMASLDGLFAKFHQAFSKFHNKIFKPHTLFGKLSDPLGLSSRNIKWGKKTADVVGTAAAIVAAAYGLGVVAAGSAGTTGGFWSTVGSGFSYAGTGIKTGAKWVGSKLFGIGSGTGTGTGTLAAKGAATEGLLTPAIKTLVTTSLVSAAMKPEMPAEPPATMTPETVSMGGGGFGGGGGGMMYGGGMGVPFPGQEPQAGAMPSESGIPMWAWIAAGGVALVAISRSRK